jgi:hypothetical protein
MTISRLILKVSSTNLSFLLLLSSLLLSSLLLRSGLLLLGSLLLGDLLLGSLLLRSGLLLLSGLLLGNLLLGNLLLGSLPFRSSFLSCLLLLSYFFLGHEFLLKQDQRMAILPQSPGFKKPLGKINQKSRNKSPRHQGYGDADSFHAEDRFEVCCWAISFATTLQCNTTESAVNVRAESYLMFQNVQDCYARSEVLIDKFFEIKPHLMLTRIHRRSDTSRTHVCSLCVA